MRPILIELPSKALAALSLIAAAAFFIRELVNRLRKTGAPWSSTPVLLFAAAWALLGLRGGHWVPSRAALFEPWVSLPIFSYGVMLGSSLVVGWFVVMKFAKQDGVQSAPAGAIYMWSTVWSMVGARALYVVTNLSAFDGLVEALMLQKGGMVAYGGMIGGFLASWYGCHRRHIPLLQWADIAAPAVVLGTGITRLGCFLYGCDYGRPSGVAWAVAFPNGSSAWDRHIRLRLITPDAAASLPVHPTQLYEAAVGFGLFALLLWIRRQRTFSGQVFLGWVLGYGLARPALEVLRDDDQRGSLGPLSTSQWIGLTSAAMGVVLAVALVRRHRQDPKALRYWENRPLPR